MARLITAALVLVFAFGGGWWVGRNDNASRVAWLSDEIERLNNAAIKQSSEQLRRQRETETLAAIVSGYELELANGSTNRCSADPVYDRRLRQILETGK